MRRIIVLLLTGLLLFALGLSCGQKPKDDTTDEEGDTVIQETLPPKDTADTTGTTAGGGAMDSGVKANPLPDTIDAPDSKGHGDT